MKFIICNTTWSEKWDAFIKSNSHDFGVLQSWEWGVFQEQLGRKVFRAAVVDEAENITVVAQIEKRKLRLGLSYFYVPRGPILKDPSHEHLRILFDGIKKLGKKEKAIFLRIEPSMLENNENVSLLRDSNFIATGQIQPKQTLILDVTQSEEELSKNMKSKTRYNIKIAQKHGITIDEGENYFEDFWRLMQKTSERDQFVAHGREYYKKMIEFFSPKGIMKLVVAKSGETVVAANVNVIFGSWYVYLHGASDYEHRNKMAPYLLQWHSIVEAKNQGCRQYDFWGVDEIKWPGVTRFKQGFDDKKLFTQYVGAWDEVYSKLWYTIYAVAKRIINT